MRRLYLLLTFACAVSLIAATASAQWVLDGVGISTAFRAQSVQKIVSDGAGGAIIVWHDYRNGDNLDIYVQRVNASGTPLWTVHGVALCSATDDQFNPELVSDGAGGAIVAWRDYRSGASYDIYAQRVNASGTPLWTANGVVLCNAANSQYDQAMISDGAGGAIVTWRDYRSGTNFDIYVQRINASGTPQWTANGVALCTAANEQYQPEAISDGAGGAIVTWHDFRSGATNDIYARRINASGTPQWAANGTAVCTAAGDQQLPTIVSDDAGGAIITWYDLRSGTYDIYAQRVNASGIYQWTANGVALCVENYSQTDPTIASDGAGGAIVIWRDTGGGLGSDIYAQRVSASGAPQWTANGIALCTATDDQLSHSVVSDGDGGAIVTWHDARSSATSGENIYAQHVDASGFPQWNTNGVALCTAANNQFSPTIVSDGAGGAIVTWYDYRSGESDIYAQRVEGRYGYWGRPEPIVTSVADIPNDQGGQVAVNWAASGRDVPVPRTIHHYTIWRAVDEIALTGEPLAGLTDLADLGVDHQGPLYAKVPSNDYYWELVGTQAAHGWAGYSFSASTRADSVAADASDEFFMVVAHIQFDDYIAFASNAISGHSVDNLAPAAPLFLTAERVGADVKLAWNSAAAPDLRDYSVYRATSTGVTPVPMNFLTGSEDTVLVDAGAPTSALHYIVTAFDVHDNQSAPSNEASVGSLTGVGNTPPITALTVLDNMPNPFSETTRLRVGLPSVSEVEIEVFDVAGRRVTSERTAVLGAGWREVTFVARDAGGSLLPSGVYFYRVRAAGETITRKMVVTR